MASYSKNAKTKGIVTCIEALRYRCLRYIDQPLESFQVLIGPNASGKSTFLDVLAFLGDLLRSDIESAVRGEPRLGIPLRAPDARHLVWMREKARFELAVEFTIPDDRRMGLKIQNPEICRYEVAVETDETLRLISENLWLMPAVEGQPLMKNLFPDPLPPPDSIVLAPRKRIPKGSVKIVSRGEKPEQVTFRSERTKWNNPFRLPANKAALSNLPEDEERFPMSTWVRRVLLEGIHRIALVSEALRKPSPPGRPYGYLPDGSNLPWVVHAMERDHPDRLKEWVQHLREALPDLESITTREREEDRHRHLILRYKSGLEAPSWLISDGTLRLLALTLLAYLPDLSGIYLIEEPENGIHPRAVETVFQSLSSVYGAQVLMATHSPVVLSLAEPDQLLCFARDAQGATDIVRGSEHPFLKEWKGGIDLGTLFASGVLG